MIYTTSPEDRLVALNSQVQHLGYLLDTSLQPTATVSDRFKTANIVGCRCTRIDRELDQLETICGGDYQSLIDGLRQTVDNLTLLNHSLVCH